MVGMPKETSGANERLIVARALAALHPGVEVNHNPKKWYSLDIGAAPNKNAVVIYKKLARTVSFYVVDESLVGRVRAVGFEITAVRVDPKRLFNKERYKVSQVGLFEIETHREFFMQLVNHSVKVMTDRKVRLAKMPIPRL